MERKSLKSSCGSSFRCESTCRSASDLSTPHAPPVRSVYCSAKASGYFSFTRFRARRLTAVGTAFPGGGSVPKGAAGSTDRRGARQRTTLKKLGHLPRSTGQLGGRSGCVVRSRVRPHGRTERPGAVRPPQRVL